MNGNSAIKKPDQDVELLALQLFLESVRDEMRERFPSFPAFVSRAQLIPQLVILE
jgi:hypothetical protein